MFQTKYKTKDSLDSILLPVVRAEWVGPPTEIFPFVDTSIRLHSKTLCQRETIKIFLIISLTSFLVSNENFQLSSTVNLYERVVFILEIKGDLIDRSTESNI